jgi:antitoxin component YwqK of YwqJK toxin-antitoxin module
MVTVSLSGVPRNGSSFAARRSYLIVLFVLGLVGASRKEEATVAQSSSSNPNVRTEEHRNAQGVLISTEGFYIDKRGKKVLHGPKIVWFDNGRKSQEVQYVDGKMHGSQIEWNRFGDRILEGTWDQDQRVGTWTGWHLHGKKASECTYKKGLIVGSKRYWNNRGKLIREDRYKEGHLREVTAWYDNGQKEYHGTFSVPKEDGSRGLFEGPPRDGVWTYWDREGKTLAQGTWKDGKPWDGICGVPRRSLINPEAGMEQFGHYRDGELIERVPHPGGR